VRTYVDPAALIRRITRDPSAAGIRQQIHESWWVGDLLATSALTRTELLRFTARFDVPQTVLADALAGIEFVPVSAEVLELAGSVGTRELDLVTALHVASALHIEAEYVISFDEQLIAALDAHGIAHRAL
jgi:predicted nucleic acid-binding protein